MILTLTKSDWKEEVRSSGLPERTRELLASALHAKMTGKQRFSPRISDEEFENMISRQVIFIRLGSRGFIVTKRRCKNGQLLVLQEET